MTHVVFLSIVLHQRLPWQCGLQKHFWWRVYFSFDIVQVEESCLVSISCEGLVCVMCYSRKCSADEASIIHMSDLPPSSLLSTEQSCRNAKMRLTIHRGINSQVRKWPNTELSLLCLFEISRSRNFWSIANLWIIVQCQYCVTVYRYNGWTVDGYIFDKWQNMSFKFADSLPQTTM